MSLTLLKLNQPKVVIESLVEFIQRSYRQAGKETAVIAVSGGIDSALALTLLTRALGPSAVMAVFLPMGDQSIDDARLIADFNQLSSSHQLTINIESIVNAARELLTLDQPSHQSIDQVRLGNLKARARMMVIYDVAKRLNALVCGTENKSEHYLGYFTRFGDAASDLEPLSQLYKTQVRQLAAELDLPATIQTKPPSAGLWADQTDEKEMGFSYAVADQVLYYLIDQQQPISAIQIEGIEPAVVQQVIRQVESMAFKRRVPYVTSS